jgi:hypothetical protein
MTELVERWEATGLLAGVDNKVKESVVACLEAQRAWNESEEDMPTAFKRVSIPVIRRAIATSEAVKRNTFVSIEESSEMKPEIYIFNSKYKSPNLPAYTNLSDDQVRYNLDLEAEAVAEFSESFRKEFDNLFKDQYKKKIYFKGLACNDEGTVYMYYNLL